MDSETLYRNFDHSETGNLSDNEALAVIAVAQIEHTEWLARQAQALENIYPTLERIAVGIERVVELFEETESVIQEATETTETIIDVAVVDREGV